MSDDPIWRRYWRALRSRLHPGVDEELAFHVSMRSAELVEGGMEPEAARREAERRFGDRTRMQGQLERIERRRGTRARLGFAIAELWRDARYAVRGLVRRPTFTIAAVSSLALGMGAATTVLSIVDPLLFRPLAVPNPDELVTIGATNRALGLAVPLVSYPMARAIAERTDLVSEAAPATTAMGAVKTTATEPGERRLFFGVSGRFFSLFRVAPSVGRLLTEADDRERQPVAVLTHRFWIRQYHGDAAAVGRSLWVNGIPFTIVGVAPPDFQGIEHLTEPDFFVPIGAQRYFRVDGTAVEECQECLEFLVVARLKPGRSVADLQAGLDVIGDRFRATVRELGEGYRLLGFSEHRARITITAAPFLGSVGLVFVALAGLVLVASSVNATNLVLTRATARRTELTLRLALGASRSRLVSQMLVENVVLSLAGLGAGVAIAWVAVHSIDRIPFRSDFPVGWHIAIDLRTFWLATAVAVGCGLVAGLGPALLASRGSVQRRLKEGSRGSVGKGGDRFRAVLVTGQIAASVVVLVFAGLFSASLRRAATLDLGIQPDHVLKQLFDASLARYTPVQALQGFDRIEREVRQVPGVVSTAWSTGLPLSSSAGTLVNVYREAPTQASGANDGLGTWMTAVGPDYFSTMGVPLIEGRGFQLQDDSSAAPVAIVNQRAAELLWPGQPAIGKRIWLEPNRPGRVVVAVAKTGKYVMIGESPRPFVYVPFKQGFQPYAYLVVRTQSDPMGAAGLVRRAIDRADPALIPAELASMRAAVDDGFNGLLLLRVGAIVATAIGLAALVLTVVGLYGLIAYSVAQRTQELGVRMALGAEPSRIVRSILAQGGRLAAIGIAIGLGLALSVQRLAAGLLVPGHGNGLVFAATALILAVVTLGSALVPARRAASLDPVQAIREN